MTRLQRGSRWSIGWLAGIVSSLLGFGVEASSGAWRTVRGKVERIVGVVDGFVAVAGLAVVIADGLGFWG